MWRLRFETITFIDATLSDINVCDATYFAFGPILAAWGGSGFRSLGAITEYAKRSYASSQVNQNMHIFSIEIGK